MIAGSWLGHKEVKRENILEKGRKSKRLEESGWNLKVNQVAIYTRVMPFWILHSILSPGWSY